MQPAYGEVGSAAVAAVRRGDPNARYRLRIQPLNATPSLRVPTAIRSAALSSAAALFCENLCTDEASQHIVSRPQLVDPAVNDFCPFIPPSVAAAT